MHAKWIFFDIGYTLVNEDEVWECRCREQVAGDEAKALGLSAADIYAEIECASRLFLPQYRTVVKKFGFENAAPYRHELEILYPDAKCVLETLSGRYRLGVIANQTGGLSERLAEFGIRGYFDAVISSWEHGIMKPDVGLFRAALAEAGCEPCDAVMVGDRLDNDIKPAKSLGMGTIWIKQGFGALQTPPSAEYEPDAEVENLMELLEIL